MTIERLERVPLRMVWPNEAYGFTPWLEENLDVLGDAIGLELANAEREQAAGTFSVDLVAEDLAGNPVIIENQLGKSDHDHLGKLLTYQVAFQASTAIWLVSDPRPEHVAVIQDKMLRYLEAGTLPLAAACPPHWLDRPPRWPSAMSCPASAA
ncbi:MAG: hypothetical protein GYB64_15445 [Chloroflexi bacterium]|nr:hypothetical protein [Chloroflexota bacterium]